MMLPAKKNIDTIKLLKYGAIGIGLTSLSILSVIGIKKLFTNSSEEEQKKREQGIDNIDVVKRKLTITNDEAELIAQTLLQAMNMYGTDEDTIKNTLEPLNSEDIKLVIKKFGIKRYAGGVLATTWFDRNYASTSLNLIGWLKAELSGQDLEDVKNKFLMEGVPF